MITMETEAGLQDKSFLQINTISESPVQFHTSSVIIEEIPDISQPVVRIKKRKAKAPMSVAAVRRSGRIEKLKAGYNEGAGSSATLQSSAYSALVIDENAPLPICPRKL
jgi:hypothetical protein